MKQSWDNLQNDLLILKQHLEDLLDILPQSTTFYKKTNAVNKAWKNLQKSVSEMDAFIMPVKSVKVQSPLLDNPEFKQTWKFWKDYLNEQHGIVMRSRAELMSLKRLADICENEPRAAIKTLEFVMSRPTDKNFYKIKDTDSSPETAKGPENKTVIKLPLNYKKAKMPPVGKPVFHQKTIQEEIERNATT